MDYRDSPKNFSKFNKLHSLRELTTKLANSILISLLSTQLVFGAEISPRLELGQYYNDNVTLAPINMEQDAFISEIQPGVIVEHDGQKFNARLEYALQALYFSSDNDAEEIYHDASAQTNFALIPESVFLDASAAYTDTFISPDGIINLDNLSLTGQSTGIVTYQVSPYVRQQYGNFANAEYRIRQEKVYYEGSSSAPSSNSTGTTSTIAITSGLAFNELNWRVFVSNIKFTAENASDATLRSSTVESNYRLSEKVEFILNVGYDDNDFEQTSVSEDPSGKYWSSGIGWNSSRRTHLKFTVGERFFGKTSSFTFNHRTHHSVWNVDYSEEVTTTAHIQQPDLGLAPEVDLGTPVLPESPVDALLPGIASVLVVDRLSMGTNYQTAKTTIELSLYNETRKYQGLDLEDQTRGGVLSISWRFMPRTTLHVSGTRYKLKLLGNSRTDYLGQAELSLERRIKRTVSGVIGVRILDRNSSDSLSEYHRNLAFVTLNMEF